MNLLVFWNYAAALKNWWSSDNYKKGFETKRRQERRNENALKKCQEQNNLNCKLSRSKLPLFPLATLEDVDELEELLEDAEQRRIQF